MTEDSLLTLNTSMLTTYPLTTCVLAFLFTLFIHIVTLMLYRHIAISALRSNV